MMQSLHTRNFPVIDLVYRLLATFHQKDTLKRFFERFEQNKLIVNRFRADCSSCSDDIVEEIAKHCKTFYIRANRCSSLYNDMNNGFGWNRLPKSFMGENTVFLLLTALIRNFYKFIMERLDVKTFRLKVTSRIKTFVFRFISVPAKWIKTSRQYVLNIYSCNNAYANVFQNDFG